MKKLYKIIIIIILVFTIFFLFSDKLFTKNNPFKEIYKVLIIPIDKITTEIKSFRTYKQIQIKNIELEKDLLLLNTTLEKNIELEKQINDLKQLTKIKKTYTEYNQIYAKIISRNNLYWFDTLVIDKGSTNNIEVGNAVVSSTGLVGRVISTSKNISTIRLITSNYEDNKLSVSIKTEKSISNGIIKEYKNNYLIVEGTTKYDDIKINSKVYTSGFGNLPKGILIGYVKEILQDQYGISNILHIEVSNDINDISYVMVLSND